MKLSRWITGAGLCAALAVSSLPGDTASAASKRLYLIPFSSGTVDPAADLQATDPAGHDLVLVQWKRFGDPKIVKRIAGTGASLVQPLAPVSYLVWADAAETRSLRDLSGVRFAGVLPPAIRIAGSVNEATTQLRVTMIGDAALEGVLGSTTRTFTEIGGSVVVVPGGRTEAEALARLPHVYSVAQAPGIAQLRDELSNQVVASGTPKGGVEPGYNKFLKKIKADGTGVIVSHVDGGVDFNHPELAGKVEACIDYTPVPKCAGQNHDDVIGHGTHTLGIILGTGSTGLSDLQGFRYGLGIAPGATAVVQNAITIGADAFRDGYTSVYRDAYKEGAIVSANSWGPAGDPQGYDEVTREFDAMVRDIDPKKKGDQEFGLVFSVMNGSGGKSTQGSPDEGKNLIGVGGTGNRGRNAPSHDDLCTCTAHGPALDGRLLPTIVAPGQGVISTRATQATLCGLPYTGSGPGNPTMETPPSPLHAACTGTSMASPHVSGGYAVFVDWYRKKFDRTPSPALVKAAFVNGADDLVNNLDADGAKMSNIPNNQQGWGRFNLGNVIKAWTTDTEHIDQSVVFSRSGEDHVITVRAADPSKPLKVSLAWTDAPGPGLGEKVPGWVNDLDLRVSGDKTYLGNVFSKGFSDTGGRSDRKNNIENVYIKNPGSGVYKIVVSAANLIGDGLPNRPGKTDQDFALVVTNARRI